jgi:hypothetical protein
MKTYTIACLSALLLLSACGRSQGPQQSAAPASGTTAPVTHDDENAALASSQFAAPIMLVVPADAFPQVQQMAALGGADPKQTNGAAYEKSDFFPCTVGANPEFIPFFEQIPAQASDVLQWMTAQGLFQVQSYTIQYPNAQMPEYGTANVFNCAVVQDSLGQFLTPGDRANGVHGGVRVPAATRALTNWTYENRYETPMPGKGNVKVFAGRLIYVLQPILPGLGFTGQGSGSVKMIMNPDSGQWEVESFELHDQRLVLYDTKMDAPVPH